MSTPSVYYKLTAECDQLRQSLSEAETQRDMLRSASALVVAEWNRQSGRVFESMGRDNLRAQSIDQAIETLAKIGASLETPPHDERPCEQS